MSRNATARLVGRSADTVSRVAADAGRTFDRTATAAATEAAAVDRRAQRVETSGVLLDVADAVTERVLSGGRDLTPHEVAALARALVDVTNAHARLAELTPDTADQDEAVSMLGALMSTLRGRAESVAPYEHPEDIHPTAEPNPLDAPPAGLS